MVNGWMIMDENDTLFSTHLICLLLDVQNSCFLKIGSQNLLKMSVFLLKRGCIVNNKIVSINSQMTKKVWYVITAPRIKENIISMHSQMIILKYQ